MGIIINLYYIYFFVILDLLVIPDDEDINSKNYEGIELCHEAGFDAYITGVLFIKLSAFLGIYRIHMLKYY